MSYLVLSGIIALAFASKFAPTGSGALSRSVARSGSGAFSGSGAHSEGNKKKVKATRKASSNELSSS